MAPNRTNPSDEAAKLRYRIEAFRRAREWSGPALHPLCDFLIREAERESEQAAAREAPAAVPPPGGAGPWH